MMDKIEAIQRKISYYEEKINTLNSGTVQFILEFCDELTNEIFQNELSKYIEFKNDLMLQLIDEKKNKMNGSVVDFLNREYADILKTYKSVD